MIDAETQQRKDRNYSRSFITQERFIRDIVVSCSVAELASLPSTCGAIQHREGTASMVWVLPSSTFSAEL